MWSGWPAALFTSTSNPMGQPFRTIDASAARTMLRCRPMDFGSVRQLATSAKLMVCESPNTDPRIARDLRTLAQFIRIYCRHKHPDAEKMPLPKLKQIDYEALGIP